MPRPQHAQWSSVQRTRQAEELALFERFALDHSPATLEPLVERYLPLARQLARRYRNSAEVEDLEQVAAIGLVKAIKRFNPHRGLAFSTFAFPTIVGELKRYLRDRSWSVKVPRSLQETSARLERATAGLAMELGRAPTVAELANRTGSSVEQVLEARQAATARRAVSLDLPGPEGDDRRDSGFDVAIDEAGFATAEQSATLAGLLGCLTPRERRILELRFRDDLTQSQIGDIVGISQMHVSRTIRRAITQLQNAATPDERRSAA